MEQSTSPNKREVNPHQKPPQIVIAPDLDDETYIEIPLLGGDDTLQVPLADYLKTLQK